jgi:hypothetical protein
MYDQASNSSLYSKSCWEWNTTCAGYKVHPFSKSALERRSCCCQTGSFVCIGRACAFPRIQTGPATFTASGFPYSLLLFVWLRSDTLMSAAQPVA